MPRDNAMLYEKKELYKKICELSSQEDKFNFMQILDMPQCSRTLIEWMLKSVVAK